MSAINKRMTANTLMYSSAFGMNTGNRRPIETLKVSCIFNVHTRKKAFYALRNPLPHFLLKPQKKKILRTQLG